MLHKLLAQSFRNQKRPMALMVLSVAMGTALFSCLLTISLDIKSKVARELRDFGANITVEPRVEGLADIASQKRYLEEADIPKAKTIFWRHNIVGISPYLYGKVVLGLPGGRKAEAQAAGAWLSGKTLPLPGGGDFKAGVPTVAPWWAVEGEAPSEGTVVVGSALAGRLGLGAGNEVLVDGGTPFKISGILRTGGPEEDQVFFDLAAFQRMKGLGGKVSKVLVSALTTPMDDFAYKDPKTMSRTEYDKWYCTGYVTSIASQLEEVFAGSKARPLWNVARTEGRVLDRLSALVWLLSAFSLAASALGVSTTMVASLLRRTHEIALMKSIGADGAKTAMIFLSEAVVIGLAGGLLGYGFSLLAVHFIGVGVFGAELAQRAVLFPVSLLGALLIAVLGSLLPIRKALSIKPAIALKEGR
jgi:putative ABC transport system permease protein